MGIIQGTEATEMLCKKCKTELPDDAIYCFSCGRKVARTKKKSRSPNGLGNVYLIKGRNLAKPWRASISSGLKRYELGYYATKSEALCALLSWKPPRNGINKNITLKEVYDIIVQSKNGEVSKASIESYQHAWKKIAHLGEIPASELKVADYQKVIDTMKSDMSRSSCEKVKILISQIGEWLIANELATINPAPHLKLPQNKKVVHKETFTEKDIAKLWSDGSQDALIILAMCYTGLRINELFMLTPNDVHIDEDGYNFLVGGEKTEAGRNRTVIIHSRLLPVFKGWKASGNKYLVVNQNGEMVNAHSWREKHYFPLLDRLGIDRITPHKARHTFATLCAEAGASPVALQKLMGHADYATTANIYTHPDMEMLKCVVELLK